MSAPDDGTEYPWVAELRKAGIQVRTGTGELSRDPDECFEPPGFRYGFRAALRVAFSRWSGRVRSFLR